MCVLGVFVCACLRFLICEVRINDVFLCGCQSGLVSFLEELNVVLHGMLVCVYVHMYMMPLFVCVCVRARARARA
jgi:hypothetical protein